MYISHIYLDNVTAKSFIFVTLATTKGWRRNCTVGILFQIHVLPPALAILLSACD